MISDSSDARVRNISNCTDNIPGTIIRRAPIPGGTHHHLYHHDRYSALITDSSNSSKVRKVESAEIRNKLSKNGKFLNLSVENEAVDRSKKGLLRSNTEIFNQILSVRKEISRLRSDIGQVQELVGHLNFNIAELVGRKTSMDNYANIAHLRPQRITNELLSTTPNYVTSLTPGSARNPLLMWVRQADVAMPAVKETLRGHLGGVHKGNLATRKLEVPTNSDQEKFLYEGNVLKSFLNWRLFPSGKNRIERNQNLLAENGTTSGKTGCDVIGKSYQKPAVGDEGAKTEEFSFRSHEVPQPHPATTANSHLLVTAEAPDNGGGKRSIALTEAFQPFSTTRYVARSKINSDKQIN